MMTLLMEFWIKVILLCWLLAFSQVASSAIEWSLDPSMRVGMEYHENIRLTTADHNAVTGRSVMPKLDLKVNSRLVTAWLGAEVRYVNYTKNELKNRNIQRYTIFSRYQQTPRSKWELTGTFWRDTTLTPVSGGSGNLPPGPGAPPALPGVIPDPDQGADNDARRNRLRLSPSWSHKLTQRSSLTLDYLLYDIAYVGDTGQNTLVDNRSQSVGVALKRSMTKRTVAGITGRYAEYEAPDVNNETDNYAVTGTIEHNFSETLSSSIQVGMRFTEAKRASTQDQSSSPIYRASLTQNIFEASSYQLLFQRRLLPSSTGSVVESDRIDLRYRHKIKSTLTFAITGRYFRNETVGGGGTSTRDRWIYFIRPSLIKKLTRHWQVDGSFSYRRQKRKTDNRSADSKAILATIKYAW